MSRTYRDLKRIMDDSKTLQSNSSLMDVQSKERETELLSKMNKLKKLSRHDKQLIIRLQERLEEQEHELDSRSQALLDIQSNVDRLSTHMKQKTATNEALKKENQDLQEIVKDLNMQLLTYSNQLTQTQGRLDEYEHKNEDRSKEVERLAEQLKAATIDSETLKKGHRLLSSQLEEKTAKIQKLENQLDLYRDGLLKEEQGKAKEYQTRLKEVEKENQILQSDVQQLQLAKDTVLRQHKETKQENEEMKRENGKVTADNADLTGKLRRLRQTLENQKRQSGSEKRRLEAVIKEHTHELSTNKKGSSQMSQDNQTLSDKCKDLSRQVRQMGHTRAQLQSDYQALEEEMKGKGAELRESRLESKRWRERAKELEREAVKWKDRVREQGEDYSQLKEAHSKLKLELQTNDAERKQHHRSTNALEDEIKDVNEQLVQQTLLTNECKLVYAELQRKYKKDLAYMQEKEAENDRLSKKMKQLFDTEKEVHDAVAKLHNAQEAMEALFTCTHCMGLFNTPLMSISCGHTFCSACLVDMKEEQMDENSCTSGEHARTRGEGAECEECKHGGGGGNVWITETVSNKLLDMLSGKFIYAKQVLTKLREELKHA